MAITFRTPSRGVKSLTSDNPFDITLPSGVAQNDILVLTIYAYDGVGYAGITTPTGWTPAGTWQADDGSNFDEIRVFWIRRGASDPSLTITRARTVYAQWSCDAIVGVRTTGNPYSAETITTVGSRANPNPGSVATTAGETVYTAVGTSAGNTTAFTAPASHTILQAGSAGDNVGSAYRAITSGSSEDPGAYGGSSGTGNCGELTWSLVVESTGNNGDASITLDAATTTATGVVDVNGTASATLDAVTSSATGAVDVNAAADITLGDVTTSATGSVNQPASPPMNRMRHPMMLINF